MAAVFFVIFYLSIGILYKIFMAALVLSIIFLLGIADETLRQIENRKL